MRAYINAGSDEEIIFTRGTTEAINLVAFSFGEAFVHAGDEIVVTEMEHHSNIVPWQMLCERKAATLRVLPFGDDGTLRLSELKSLLSERTKLVAVTQVSNVLGTINPIADIIGCAHARNIPVLVDGAQAAQHFKPDVQAIDCDFYVFSGHKAYGPTGIGVLYGKKQLLQQMPPYQGGGEMISHVSFAHTTYNELPFKFEAGTPNYIDAIAFAEAIKYIDGIGLTNIARHENELLVYATEQIQTVPGIRIIGTAQQKSGVLSFLLNGTHPSDVGILLDKLGIAARTGTHCAEPIMQHYNIPGTVRISFSFYNTLGEIDSFIKALKRVATLLCRS